MQAEQDTLSLSARSFSNEFSYQHNQFLTGSRLGDQNVDIYAENPDPNASMLFGCGIYGDQYAEPVQQFKGIPPVQIANDLDPIGHPNSGLLSRSHENTHRSFGYPHDGIQFNTLESSDNNMIRSMVPTDREQAPTTTSLHTMVSHVTPPRQASRRKRDDPKPKIAHSRPQGKPSETDQAIGRRARKGRDPARKDKKHVEQYSFRVAKGRPSKKPALESNRYPHNSTIAACSLWLSQNSGKMPSEHVMSCLSMCFGSSIEPIRNWFMGNVTVSIEDEDTGYQTMTDLETDINSLYRGNRGCKRKATSIGVRAVTSIQIPRNEARPYACTSRCSKCFKNKADWERHEEKNRVQRLWVCSFESCRNKEQRKRVWLNRKEHFINHVSNYHPGLGTKPRDIDNCYVEMKSNFDKRCILKSCKEIFHSWKERINHIGEHLRNPWHMSEWRDMDEDEKDTDATNASEDDNGDSESDDLGSESDSDDTEDGAPGLGPSDSSYDQGADRLGGHPGSSVQRPGSSSHHSRHKGDDYTRPSKYDNMNYGCQADSSVSDVSLAEPFPRSENRFSVSSQARPKLNKRHHIVICLGLALQPIHQLLQVNPLRFLGRGSSSLVDEVKMKGYVETLAPKRTLSCTQIQQRSLHREVMIIARLKLPQVISLGASYQQLNLIKHLLRPVADCNLLQDVTAQSSGPGYRSKMQGWFRCLAFGLRYLHNGGVIYQDIKPGNMLLGEDRVPYTDFASSNIIPDDDSSESDSVDFTERYAVPDVHDIALEHIYIPPTPLNIVEQAFLFADNSDIILTDEEFFNFERQPLEAQRHTLNVFFKELTNMELVL